MSPTQVHKAEALRSLHHGDKPLVLANAWDAASARIFEDLGFPAIATSSAGVAFTLGYPDGQFIPRDEMLLMTRRIASVAGVPVTADIEAGFGGDNLDELLATVRGVMDAGVVGINLEDGDAGGLYPIDVQAAKIRAIRGYATEYGVPLVINARTDAFRVTGLTNDQRIEAALGRAAAYLEAGADCIFTPFVTDIETIEVLAKGIAGPLNILAVAGSPPVSELARAGVARISTGGGPCRAALGMARRIGRELLETGTYAHMAEGAVSYAEMNALLTE